MTGQEYKVLIIRMLEKITSENDLKRIFAYVHHIFINRTGE